MKDETKEKIDKIMKSATEKEIISPKQLINDERIIKDYQEWSRLIKIIKNFYPAYEIRELSKDELKAYNIKFMDDREKYYLFIDKVIESQLDAYIKLLKNESISKGDKIKIIKNIISSNFVKNLRLLKVEDINYILGEIISIIKSDESYIDKLSEIELITFFSKCINNFNLSNEIKKSLSELSFKQFHKEKKDFILMKNVNISRDNIIGWYKLYLSAYLNIFSSSKINLDGKETTLEPPELGTILKWGKEDMESFISKDEKTEQINNFINFYKSLLVEHIKSIEEQDIISQRLKLNYEDIIKNRVQNSGYKSDFYLLFENLDNWNNWDIELRLVK
mgnify:CR=1 FL=1